MFGGNGKQVPPKGKYQQISLDEFSDDDSDHDDLTPPSRGRNSSAHGGGGNSPHGHDGNGDTASSAGIGRQHELLQKQDEGLEMLSQSAERLGAMSLQIGDELNFQNKMLDDMEQDLERADEDLDMVTRQTKKFIEQAGGTKNCVIIAALTLVVVVLLILLIYF